MVIPKLFAVVDMRIRHFRDTAVSCLTSAVVHLAAGWGLAWSFTHSAPEFSLESSAATGEISSVLTLSMSAETAEPTVIAPQPPMQLSEQVDPPKTAELPDQPPPPTSGAKDHASISQRPIVVRERLSRVVALATLPPLERADEEPADMPAHHPQQEVTPLCEELWKRTTDLPKRIDFEAVEKLLQQVSANRPIAVRTEMAIESADSMQGSKVDRLPKPGPRNLPPAYPAAARQSGHSGRVLLSVLVAVDGTAQDVQLAKSSGYPSLDEAALAAVKQWRFEPARRNGAAVKFSIDVPIRFRLTP